MAKFFIGQQVKIISLGALAPPAAAKLLGTEARIVGEGKDAIVGLVDVWNLDNGWNVRKDGADECLVPILPPGEHAPCDADFAEDFKRKFGEQPIYTTAQPMRETWKLLS